jgi:hypothetical protein
MGLTLDPIEVVPEAAVACFAPAKRFHCAPADESSVWERKYRARAVHPRSMSANKAMIRSRVSSVSVAASSPFRAASFIRLSTASNPETSADQSLIENSSATPRLRFRQALVVGCKSAGHHSFFSTHIFAASRALSNSVRMSLDALTASTLGPANERLGTDNAAPMASLNRLRTRAINDIIIAAPARIHWHLLRLAQQLRSIPHISLG